MSNNICPVCGNQGIPAYHKEDVICPRCGSDLSIYRMVSNIAEANCNTLAPNKRYKRLAIIVPLIILLVSYFPIYSLLKQKSDLEISLQGKDKEITMLEDSIKTLEIQILMKKAELLAKKTEILIPQPTSSTYTEYVVVYNDSPWKIVRKFYGVGDDWEEISKKIAIDNHMWDNDKAMWKQIHPGQVIKIYNR